MELQLQKGIPVPPKTRDRKSKYPWDTMEVDESFFIPKSQAPSASSLSTGAKKYNIKITARNVEENGKAGVRVWRVG